MRRLYQSIFAREPESLRIEEGARLSTTKVNHYMDFNKEEDHPTVVSTSNPNTELSISAMCVVRKGTLLGIAATAKA